MDIAKIIKLLLVEEDTSKTDLAKKLGTSRQNLSQKLKNEKISVHELRQIALLLNRELKIEFVKKDNGQS